MKRIDPFEMLGLGVVFACGGAILWAWIGIFDKVAQLFGG